MLTQHRAAVSFPTLTTMNATANPATTIICFDLGGVIVRICRSFAQACAAAGIEHRDPERFSTPDLQAARAALHSQYQIGAIDDHAFFTGVAANAAGLYSATDIRAIHDAWILGEYPGITPLIAELNTMPGIATACLSNTNNHHWRAMHGQLDSAQQASSDALRSIQHRLASHELRLAKPNTAIYRCFERAIGATPPRIIFFDDLQDNIASAASCGWRAYQIDHEGDTPTQIKRALVAEGVLPG